MAGRRLEADRLALADLFALADALDRDAVLFDPVLEIVEVVFELDLEREPVEADAWVVPDGQAVVVPLVPALEEEAVAVRITGALDQFEPSTCV